MTLTARSSLPTIMSSSPASALTRRLIFPRIGWVKSASPSPKGLNTIPAPILASSPLRNSGPWWRHETDSLRASKPQRGGHCRDSRSAPLRFSDLRGEGGRGRASPGGGGWGETGRRSEQRDLGASLGHARGRFRAGDARRDLA